MRFRAPFNRRDPAEWSRWFAWYPVRSMDGQYLWLETVERRVSPLASQKNIVRAAKKSYSLSRVRR